MNETLWNSVQQFDFDHPSGEYIFSIRLASANRWTKDFTEKAILEYKKFMYLAAISDVMVHLLPLLMWFGSSTSYSLNLIRQG
ncbi:hypothetical protein QF042_004382 [Pedobacter sp. W3I1]|uniref:hypothetical protein n=1 Tax=Pedobacter sp. W3I1 TaxID=3042291 RepID=UPI00278B7730|nr:hypothetical protein [Pedobacter sp. W3I1]MDQ0640817.1 hypothetical protein [Pedobacter sp. W3I1]